MAESSSEKGKRVAKNTLFLFIRMIVVMAVGLYTSRVVLQVLGVDNYGVYNVVGSVVVLFSFLKQAMTNATYRFLTYSIGTGDKAETNRIFSMAINSHAIIVAVVLLLTETIGLWAINHWLKFPQGSLVAANVVYQFSMISFCVEIMRTPYNSVIIAHERMGFYAITSLIEACLQLCLVYLLLVLPGNSLINYSLMMLAISFIMFLWYHIFCRRNFQETKYHRYWSTPTFKSMISYSGWSIVVNLADVGVAQSISFFFNIFWGVALNAALGVAQQVNNQLNRFLSNFTQSFNPQIIKGYAEDNLSYFHRLLYSSSKMGYFLLFLVAIPILLNIRFILSLWLTVVPEFTATFIVMIVLYSLIDAYSQPLWIAVHATGKLRTHQLLMGSIKILNIPLAYIMLKIGMAAWTVLALKAFLNFVCSIVRPIYLRKLIKLPFGYYCRSVFLPISLVTIISLPIPLLITLNVPQGWLHLFLSCFTFFAIFPIATYFIGLNQSERRLIINVVSQRFSRFKRKAKKPSEAQ